MLLLTLIGLNGIEENEMTEQQADDAFDLYQTIWGAVHALLDSKMVGMSEEQEIYIRDRLTDEFRFWKLVNK